MRLWSCEAVRLWSCETMKLWAYETVRLWSCEAMKLWDYETVSVWDCEAMKLWGCEAMKLWGYEAVKTIAVWRHNKPVLIWLKGSTRTAWSADDANKPCLLHQFSQRSAWICYRSCTNFFPLFSSEGKKFVIGRLFMYLQITVLFRTSTSVNFPLKFQDISVISCIECLYLTK